MFYVHRICVNLPAELPQGMRKLLTLTLLSLLLFNAGGYYLLFKISQRINYNHVRREIRAGVSEAELEVIRVPIERDQEIIWQKRDREFVTMENCTI